MTPAVLQAICAQIPTDNDPRCMAAADVQRKANAELLRIFSGAWQLLQQVGNFWYSHVRGLTDS